MLIIKIYRKLARLFSVDLISTLLVNSKLPWRQFVKFPIWIYGGKINCLDGKIEIDSPHITTGMIRLGLKTSGMPMGRNFIDLTIRGGGNL